MWGLFANNAPKFLWIAMNVTCKNNILIAKKLIFKAWFLYMNITIHNWA